MCSNYKPVSREDWLLSRFGAPYDARWPAFPEVWPLGLAPFIRLHEDGSGNRVLEQGHFGLLPHFATEIAYGRKTYNARSETVHRLPSFRDAWREGRRCIVPAEVLFEPCYESGRAVRWGVQQPDGTPMGIAGIYYQWRDKSLAPGTEGALRWTFAMLTVNADGHPVYQRMHRPEDEKRMVVILNPEDYGRWLSCSPDEAKQFFRQWTGRLECFPAPTRRQRNEDKERGDDPDQP